MIYSADFEATVEEMDLYNYEGPDKSIMDHKVVVTWAGLQNCHTMKQQYWQTRYKGNKFIDALDSFMNTVKRLNDGSIICFHNLKGYDHGFIFHWAFKNGYSINGVPSDFRIKFDKGNVIRFFDTLNLLTTSIKDMAKMVDLKKGGMNEIETPLVSSFDKNKTTIRVENLFTEEYQYHEFPYSLNEMFKIFNWQEYALEDINVLAHAINHFQIEKLLYNKINTKSNWAWQMMWKANYKSKDILDFMPNPYSGERIEKYKFEEDQFVKDVNPIIREAYKGGMTYVNPKHQSKRIKRYGRTYDITSMYPWIYSTKPLPKSRPSRVFTSDAIDFDKQLAKLDLYIIILNGLEAKLKSDKTMPWLKDRTKQQVTDNNKYYLPDYKGNATITSVEYKELVKDYDFKYNSAFVLVFERDIELENKFKAHLDYWLYKKENAINEGERFIAKLMLNSVYGKLAQFTKNVPRQKFNINDDGIIEASTWTSRSGYDHANVAGGAFITAYGRMYLKNIINKYGDDFIYCDTDSVHVFGDKVFMHVHDKALGAFKLENEFSEGIWLNPKTYMEYDINSSDWICRTAGNDRPVKIDEFKLGQEILTHRTKYVKGDRIIYKMPFRIGQHSLQFNKLKNDLLKSKSKKT